MTLTLPYGDSEIRREEVAEIVREAAVLIQEKLNDPGYDIDLRISLARWVLDHAWQFPLET